MGNDRASSAAFVVGCAWDPSPSRRPVSPARGQGWGWGRGRGRVPPLPPGAVRSRRPDLTQQVAEVHAPLDMLSSQGQRIPTSLQAPSKRLRFRRQKRTENGMQQSHKTRRAGGLPRLRPGPESGGLSQPAHKYWSDSVPPPQKLRTDGAPQEGKERWS